MSIFHPEAFQGKIKNKSYFEGWYLKQVSADRSAIYSFIPGISLSKTNSHAFVQVINGLTAQTRYISFPVESFRASRNQFDVKIGTNQFSNEGISLNLIQDDLSITGKLSFENHIQFPKSIFAPGIMGPFTYFPNMECNHGLVSANHKVKGSLLINGSEVNFTNGDGYIEKDWGRSFPQSWIWVQCNSFNSPDSSCMLSIAKIPSFGTWFTGFLGFFYHQGVFHTFATWNKSKIVSVERSGSFLTIVIKKGKLTFILTAEQKSSGTLLAPSMGTMDRHIKESVDSTLTVTMKDRNATIAHIKGFHAGMEVIESIFEVLKKSGIPCTT